MKLEAVGVVQSKHVDCYELRLKFDAKKFCTLVLEVGEEPSPGS